MRILETEETTDHLRSQGASFEAANQIQEALECYQRALWARERVLGHDAAKTIMSVIDVVRCLSAQGRFAEALPSCERALEWCDAEQSRAEGDNLSMLHGLYGAILRGVGRYTDALTAYEASITAAKSEREKNTTLNNMAGVFKDMGQYNKALECYQEAYPVIKSIHGEESPEALSVMNNIATTMLEIGEKLDTVLDIFKDVYSGYLRICGEQHPNTITTAASVGITLNRLDRYDESERWQRAALQAAEQLFGERNQPCLSIANGLGLNLVAQKKLDEGIEVLSKCLTSLIVLYGVDHPKVLTTRSNLATALVAKGLLEEALQEQEAIYEGYVKALGPDHPNALKTKHQILCVLAELGRYGRAAEVLEEQLSGFEEKDPKGPRSLLCLEDLEELYRIMGDVSKADETAEMAKQLREQLGITFRVTTRLMRILRQKQS
jgi:tetratricopeptide (TPR) repeat protein